MGGVSIKIAREMPFKVEKTDIDNFNKSLDELKKWNSIFIYSRDNPVERSQFALISAFLRAYDEPFYFDCYGFAIRNGFAFGALDRKGTVVIQELSNGHLRGDRVPLGDYRLLLLERPYDLSDKRLDERHVAFFKKLHEKEQGLVEKKGPKKKKPAYGSAEWYSWMLHEVL